MTCDTFMPKSYASSPVLTTTHVKQRLSPVSLFRKDVVVGAPPKDIIDFASQSVSKADPPESMAEDRPLQSVLNSSASSSITFKTFEGGRTEETRKYETE